MGYTKVRKGREKEDKVKQRERNGRRAGDGRTRRGKKNDREKKEKEGILEKEK